MGGALHAPSGGSIIREILAPLKVQNELPQRAAPSLMRGILLNRGVKHPTNRTSQALFGGKQGADHYKRRCSQHINETAASLSQQTATGFQKSRGKERAGCNIPPSLCGGAAGYSFKNAARANRVGGGGIRLPSSLGDCK